MDNNPTFLKNSYCIIKEKNLIVEYHKGIGLVQDAMEFRRKQAADPAFSSSYNVIMDLRDFVFDVDAIDLEEFGDFYRQNMYLTGKRKIGIITDTPNQVVAITLFKQMNENLPQSIKMVSTIIGAMNWVCCDLTLEQIGEILKDLKEKAV